MAKRQQNNKESKTIVNIPISELKDDLIDYRSKTLNQKEQTKENEAIERLANNIKNTDLQSPICITPTKSIISGRRRFKALKLLGWKKVPCVISYVKDKKDISIMSLSENILRNNLSLLEINKGIGQSFLDAGFDPYTSMSKCKHIHNTRSRKDTEPKFLEVLDKIGLAPNYVYQHLQIYAYLSSELQEYMEKLGLRFPQRVLLTHSKLKQHPKIIRQLAEQIKDYDLPSSRVLVAQTIRDLDTGAITKYGDSYIVYDDQREKIDKLPQVEKTPTQKYFAITTQIMKLMKLITDHQLTRGEAFYTENHIKYSGSFRRELLKNLDARTLMALQTDTRLLTQTLDALLESIEEHTKEPLTRE